MRWRTMLPGAKRARSISGAITRPSTPLWQSDEFFAIMPSIYGDAPIFQAPSRARTIGATTIAEGRVTSITEISRIADRSPRRLHFIRQHQQQGKDAI